MSKEATIGYIGFWLFIGFIIHEFSKINEMQTYTPIETALFVSICIAYMIYTAIFVIYIIKSIKKGGDTDENIRHNNGSGSRNGWSLHVCNIIQKTTRWGLGSLKLPFLMQGKNRLMPV